MSVRRRRRGVSRRAPPAAIDSAAIDALYGLEPVYEPSTAGAEATGFVVVECPYCWERYDTPVDLSAGSFEHVEDCQVCCQPIELAVDVADDGTVAAVRAARLQ